jgi:hypothetical protein
MQAGKALLTEAIKLTEENFAGPKPEPSQMISIIDKYNSLKNNKL